MFRNSISDRDITFSSANFCPSIYRRCKHEGQKWFSMGLDISMNRTGVTLIKDSHVSEYISFAIVPSFLDYVFNGKKSKIKKTPLKGYKRIEYVESVIYRLLATYSPKYITLEGYSLGSKGRVFDIAEFTGAIKMVLQKYLDRPDTYGLILTPHQLKKIASDNGGISKDQIYRFCNSRFNTDFSDKEKDEVDSFICAITPVLMHNKEYRDSKLDIYDTIELIKSLSHTTELF